MSYKPVESRVGPPFREGRRFGGLSDRALPLQLSRVECPDLINADFSERGVRKRLGWGKVTAALKDASISLDGVNDFGRITINGAIVPSAGEGFYVGIAVVLRSYPPSNVTIVQSGFGATTNMTFRLYLEPGSGAWVVTVWDATAATLRTYTLTDEFTGVNSALGAHRYLEWFQETPGGAVTFRRWDAQGNVTTSADTTPVTTYVPATQDWTIGIPMTSANVISTADAFLHANLAEFRIARMNGSRAPQVTAANRRYIRELTPTDILADVTGYWKLNDGTADSRFRDSTATANHGSFPANTATWTFDQATIAQFGGSGLAFQGALGSQSWIRLEQISTAGSGAPFQSTFTATAPNVSRWTLRGMFLPYIPIGAAAVPNQNLLWFGSNISMPQPLGLRVTSNRFEALYNDGGGSPLSLVLDQAGHPTVTSLVGQRVRWAIYRHGTGTGTLTFKIAVLLSGAWQTYERSVATTGTPSAISQYVAIARKATSFVIPYTFTADGDAHGVMDDIQLVHTNASTVGTFVGTGTTPSGGAQGWSTAYWETPNWNAINPVHTIKLWIRMNEGGGNFLTSDVNAGDFLIRLLPEGFAGIRWGEGLVEPYTAPETYLMTPYNRIAADGSKQRSLLVIHGATLYDVNVTTGAVMVVGTNLIKPTSGKWVETQYGFRKVFASANGQRPVSYDGTGLNLLGIAPPLSAPVVTPQTTGGTFVASTYYVYVTFRNSKTTAESNPSPGVGVTFTTATSAITSIQVPTSSDPQVDQRRIYITLAGGVDGATAYLSTTINDNSTTNYIPTPPAIAGPPVSGVSLLYFSNQEAPQASLATVWKDFIFLAGNQQFPGRVYRNSFAGAIDGFDQDVYYITADNNSGDPVTGFMPIYDKLLVELSDGRAPLFLTGDPDNPFTAEIINLSHGAVAQPSMVRWSSQFYYLAETDFYITDGYKDQNLSSPPDQSSPSIRNLMRKGLNKARRSNFVGAENVGRNQVWWAVSSTTATRNDMVLVYDVDLALWTKYDLALDYIVSYESGTDDSELYGAIQGFIVKLDALEGDGVGAPINAEVEAVAANVVTVSGAPFTGLDLRGYRAHIYRSFTNTVQAVTIYSNTESTFTPYETLVGLVADDILIVGGIPFYVEFVWDHGDPLQPKRARWLKLAGFSDNDLNLLRVSYKANDFQRVWNYSGVTEVLTTWVTSEPFKLVRMGGIGRSFRIRIGESGVPAPSSSLPMPSGYGAITLLEFAGDMEALDIL